METTTTSRLTTKHIAAKHGIKPIQLRRVLRSMPEYADGVHTNYSWDAEKDKAAIKRIDETLAARTKAKAEKAEAAKAALAAASTDQPAKPAAHAKK